MPRAPHPNPPYWYPPRPIPLLSRQGIASAVCPRASCPIDKPWVHRRASRTLRSDGCANVPLEVPLHQIADQWVCSWAADQGITCKLQNMLAKILSPWWQGCMTTQCSNLPALESCDTCFMRRWTDIRDCGIVTKPWVPHCQRVAQQWLPARQPSLYSQSSRPYRLSPRCALQTLSHIPLVWGRVSFFTVTGAVNCSTLYGLRLGICVYMFLYMVWSHYLDLLERHWKIIIGPPWEQVTSGTTWQSIAGPQISFCWFKFVCCNIVGMGHCCVLLAVTATQRARTVNIQRKLRLHPLLR